MRKMSKAAKVEGYDRLKSERDALDMFAWHVVNGHKPDAVEIVKESNDDGTYEISLYGAARVDGGTVAIVFKHPINQFHHVDVERFEDWVRKMRDLPYCGGSYTELKIAADRLRVAQRKAWDNLRNGGTDPTVRRSSRTDK